MPTSFQSVPGVHAGASITPRNIFVGQTSANLPRYAPSRILIDGAKSRDTKNSPTSVLRAGTLLGKVTANGKYANSIIGTSAVLHDTSVVTTTMTLPASVVTEIQRRIGNSGTFKISGPPTAAGTVATETVTFSAIASATTITITATAADFAAGSIIRPADGSETPLTVLDQTIFGTDMTDISGNSIDQALERFLFAADLIAAQIPFLTTDGTTATDASVQTFIKTFLKAGGANNAAGVAFTFDNDR
jgi:hypothetical protein